MKTAFIIYCRAVGFYAVLTLFTAVRPEVFVTSLRYALTYGWFAWLVFTLLYLFIAKLPLDFVPRFFSLFMAVIVAVAFAYQMLGMLAFGEDVWHSLFVLFPFTAVISGWISVCLSRETIRRSCYVGEK